MHAKQAIGWLLENSMWKGGDSGTASDCFHVIVKEHTELLAACKRLEWSGWAHFQRSDCRPQCPACKGLQNDMKINDLQTVKGGHVPNCWLAAVIAKA